MKLAEKYKQIILNLLKYGADEDGKITSVKLASLAYLADFTWYYINSTSMTNMSYRKLPHEIVANAYLRVLHELEEDGMIIREQKGNAILFSLVEKEAPADRLTDEKLSFIKKIGQAWRGKSTNEIVEFIHEQLPWQICRDGEIIPYGLITQEEPARVYGTVQL